jgi:hypothetical protein
MGDTVLHSFTNDGSDGYSPYAGLIMDGSGNLYGTTSVGGVIFELVKSSGTYTEKVLYSSAKSANSYAGLIMDGSGDLYGTTFTGGGYGGGTVFELVNSSGSYSEKAIHNFQPSSALDGFRPYAGLVMDGAGNLYGATLEGGATNNGTVFELSPFSGPAQTTTTTLTSSLNPADAGQNVTLSAVVTVARGLPTGTITFSTGGTVLGMAPVSGGVATLGVGLADILGIGTFNITAQYTPDSVAFAPSSGTISQTVTEQGVVLTSGNNTLNGNQTVNGTVSATSYTGNGSGLTGVNAATAATASGLTCTACVGNTQLAVSYAGSATQGGPATSALNALMLGGLLPSAFQPAGSYATTGANLFSGNQSITGNLILTGSLTGGSANLAGLSVSGNFATAGTVTIGAGGTPITEHLSMTVNPTFPALMPGAFCTTASFALASAADGDTIALGVPNERMVGGLVYTAWVSAANTITVQVCTFTPVPSMTFGSGAIRVDLWKH